MEDDNLAEYRTFCANRMRRLERCKKAKSFCSLEDEVSSMRMPSASGCRAEPKDLSFREHRNASRNFSCPKPSLMPVQPSRQPKPEPINASSPKGSDNMSPNKFEMLRQNLISLMENDVRLLQQLLALGDSIQELKRKQQSGSQSSLNSSEYDEDFGSEEKNFPFNSDVTNVYLDDDEAQQNADVYFSRKDSVLRIPIAPRNSNRKNSLQRVSRKPSELRSSRLHPVLDGSEMNMITRSIPNSALPSPANCTSSSARASTGSIDSGIRDAESSSPSCSSPSPTFKDQKF